MNVLKRMVLCLVLLAGVMGSQKAHAQGEQTAVIGLGVVGWHTFSHGDDIRDATFTVDLNGAGMNQVYVEWYPFSEYENLGFGLRSVMLGIEEKATVSAESASATVTTNLTVLSYFLTVSLLPYISESGYWRLGFLAGLGVSDYKLTHEAEGGTGVSFSSSGPASLVQFYIDWGGEAFGARFGVGTLKTQLKDVEVNEIPDTTLTADASGTHAYIDLRWAF